MGNEVFDDVAFFYVALGLIASIVIPVTARIVFVEVGALLKSGKGSGSGGDDDKVDSYTEKQLKARRIVKAEPATAKYMKKRYLLLVVAWAVLAYMLTLVPSMTTKSFASFEPYTILDVPLDASEADIRRAYRKLSLRWHPDKNEDKTAAEAQFMLIAKAYAALTDPRTKANMEKYGNPDGYKGFSMTYGLPEFLSSRDNELLVLVCYVLIFLAVPLGLFYLYVRKASALHPSGVHKETAGRYVQVVTEQLQNKGLMEPLCMAEELAVFTATPEREAALQQMLAANKDRMAPAKFDKVFFIAYANALLTAHMSRRPALAPQQEADLVVLLNKLPLLAHTITEISKARRFTRPFHAAIDVQQHAAQAMWFGEPPLVQLPHVGLTELSALARKNIKTLQQFREGREEDVRAALMASLTQQQFDEVLAAAAAIPALKLDVTCAVPGQERIVESDLVHIDVDVSRLRVKLFEQRAAAEVAAEAEKQKQKQAKAQASLERVNAHKRALQEAAEAGGAEDEAGHESALLGAATSAAAFGTGAGGKKKKALSAEEKAAADAALQAKLESWDIFESPAGKKKGSGGDGLAPYVFAPRMPVAKRESWYVSLFNVGAQTPILCDSRVLRSLSDVASVKFNIQAPPNPGLYVFEVQVRSDSYVGIDCFERFPMVVEAAKGMSNRKRKVAAARAADAAKSKAAAAAKSSKASVEVVDGEDDDDEDAAAGEAADAMSKSIAADIDEDDEDEEEDDDDDDDAEAEAALQPAAEEPGKWYFLGAASFLEMLLNVIVLGVLFYYVHSFLHSRGLWQKWFEPLVDAVWSRAGPYVLAVHEATLPVTAPITGVLMAVFERFLGASGDMPAHIRQEKLNRMKSQKHKRTPF